MKKSWGDTPRHRPMRHLRVDQRELQERPGHRGHPREDKRPPRQRRGRACGETRWETWMSYVTWTLGVWWVAVVEWTDGTGWRRG